MPRSDALKRLVLGLLATAALSLIGTSPALATSQDDPAPDPAKEKAAAKVADAVCSLGPFRKILKPLQGIEQGCTNKVKQVYADGPNGVTSERICGAVLPGKAMAIPRFQCKVVLKPFVLSWVKQYEAAYKAAQAVKGGFKIAKFIANPQNGIQDLANETKDSSMSLANAMAQDLVKSTPSFNARYAWWGAKYRQALVLGLAVLAGMTLLTIRSAATKQNDEELATSILMRLPIAVLAMCFAPAIGVGIMDVSNAIAQAAVPTFSDDLNKYVDRLANISAATATVSPLLGILLFGLIFVGVALVIVALLMHTLALYLTGVAMAVVWGFYVNPRWRPQVSRITAFWVSTAFAKPLLIFMLGVAFAVAGNVEVGAGSLTEVLNLGIFGLAVLMVGLTPLALVKFIPLLPSSTESMRPASGGSVVGSGVSAAASVAMSRAEWGSQREKSSHSSQQTNTKTNNTTSTASTATTSRPGQDRQNATTTQTQQPAQPAGQPGQSTSATPSTDPSTVTKPVTDAGGQAATTAAVAAGGAVGGPAGAAAAAAIAAGAKAAGEKARQTAAGVAPDIARQDGGERQ
ncbi:MAG TPA: hypothetical protein VGL36_35460 [Kribbella sp.]